MNYYFNLTNCNYIDFFNYNNRLLDFRNFDYCLKFNFSKYIHKCAYFQLFKVALVKNIRVNIFYDVLLKLDFNNIYSKIFNNNVTDIDRIDLNKNLTKVNVNNDNYIIDLKNFNDSYFIKYYLALYGLFNNVVFLTKFSTLRGFVDIYNRVNLFIKDNKFIQYVYYDINNIIVSKFSSINRTINSIYRKLIFNNNNNFINYFIHNKNIINKINNIDIFNKFIFNDLLDNCFNNFLSINNIRFNNSLYKYKINTFNSNVKLNNINFSNVINILNIFKKNKKFEEYISNFIFGQEDQLYKLSTIEINKLFSKKYTNSTKPIGSWIICGPSGVGKTEVAKVISKLLYNDKSKFIKLDMSEFMDKYTVSRLIGAPPGYLGYEKGGELTNFISNTPDSVILFDEAEKANKYIYDLLLQVLDEGVLTDSKGVKIFFNKSILVFTSNIGSDFCKNNVLNNSLVSDIIKELRKFFRVEFLNRLDDIIVFNYLSLFSIYKVMDKFFYNIDKLCVNSKNIKLILSLIFNKSISNTRKIIRILESSIINKVYEIKENNDIIIDICNKSLIYKIL